MLSRWLKSTYNHSVGRCWTLRYQSSRVVVLCYHSVHPSKPAPQSVPPAFFEAQLCWLKEHCEVIRFQDAIATARAPGRTRPAVAITFDDGYDDNHKYALPLLQKYGITATFFLTVGLLEAQPAVVERLHRLLQCSTADVRGLEWGQAKEMRDAGMEIGVHTMTHPNLARLSAAEVERELEVSKHIAEQRLGSEVTLMSYPFGKPGWHFDDETARIAAQLGFKHAAMVACRAVHPNDSYLKIPRMFATAADIEAKVFGAWDFLSTWQQTVPLSVAKVISPHEFSV